MQCACESVSVPVYIGVLIVYSNSNVVVSGYCTWRVKFIVEISILFYSVSILCKIFFGEYEYSTSNCYSIVDPRN